MSPPAGPSRLEGPLGGLDTLMWRLGRHHPRFRATMSLVAELDGPVALETVRGAVGRVVDAEAGFGHRVVAPSLPMAPPRWEPDPGFALDDHVRAVAGRGAGLGTGLRIAEELLATDFAPGRPPWQAVLVVPEGRRSRSALVVHLHHSYTDGVGGVELLGRLFDFGPAPPVPGPARVASSATAGPPVPERSLGGALAAELAGELRRSGELAARALPWALRSLVTGLDQPDTVLATLRDVAGALGGHWRAANGPASPLLAPRSAAVRLGALTVDLGLLRRGADRAGGSINDVFLAGLTDGLARYHVKRGSSSPQVRLGMPISTRTGTEGVVGAGNQICGAILRGPLGELPFDERVRLVGEITAAARRQPWAESIDDLAAVAVRLPAAVPVLAAALASIDVVGSNVAGPPVEMTLGGVPVRRLVPVGPRSGSALNATLLSYAGGATIGVNADPAAVPDLAMLTDCLGAAFEEGLAGS